MKVLVCGDRNWTDDRSIRKNLDAFSDEAHIATGDGRLTVIHGACRGADDLAGQMADERGWLVIEFPANWNEHGKAAGPIRNRLMLTEGLPDVVFAFHRDLSKSKGTKDMVLAACSAGVPVRIFPR